MLTIYKASAGSGKTFRLVVEYLKLILDNPFNYQHILAVTFTNKATNEMKSRILEQLNQIANGEHPATIEVLKAESGQSEQFIRTRARQVLKNILHDYNRFAINTIDSFTQKVIKSFNRELGISPNFSVELDNDMILEEAVARLFAKIGTNKNLLKWLKEYSRERIEANHSQRLDTEILNLGSELFKERFQVFFPEDDESVYTREKLNDFVKEVKKLKSSFEQTLKNKGKQAVDKMENAGLTPADFSGGASRSVGAFLVKLAQGDLPNFTNTVRNAASDAEKWVTKTNKKRDEIIAKVEQNLRPALEDIVAFFDLNFAQYNTSIAVLKQIRTLGILIDLKDEIKELLHEKSILPLSDSNLLLSKIIGQSDSPFVYEKMGNYYKHFMLDEFQDTSGLQWHNFKPLILNALAEGNSNLIVGDVKQSIYRWRNSDWSILAEQLQRDFTPRQRREETLEFNFRSDQNIIAFNNTIFGALLDQFENRLFGEIPDSQHLLNRFKTIYSEFEQKPGNPKAPQSGYIQANFFPADEFQDASTEYLIEQVKFLQDSGIRAEEIAILTRTNGEGTRIIEAFLNAAKKEENRRYNLSVLSNESLFLHASKGVLFIIHCIELLVDPGNPIHKATLLHLWMSWLKPEQKGRNCQLPEANAQQVLAFGAPETWQLNSNYEEEFEQELGELLETIKQKVLLASLDEVITKIASLSGLFNLEAELPFIQTLIDKAGDLKTSLSNDLSNLLFWWHEKGFKTSVNINEEIDAIRLLTVHKSKGLEFKAVLLPYFNWKTEPGSKQMPILWCQPQSAPFNQFPLLPIQCGTAMKESEFAQEYFEEKVNNYIDSMNLVYVAFTRAKSVLMVNCPQPGLTSKGDEKVSTSVDYLFLKALLSNPVQNQFPGAMNNEGQQFEFGTITGNSTPAPHSNTLKINQYAYHDFSERVKLRISGEDFLVESDDQHSEKNTGKLVHEILSQIESANDVHPACVRAFKEGKINETELQEIEAAIQENLKIETVKPWFNNSYQVLNERDLLSENQLLRPDRIMYAGENAIVVDYKTGEKIPTKYHRQVENYAQTLKQSGFKKVTGYLWYLSSNEVEKVCEL